MTPIPTIPEQALATVPLYTMRDTARHLRLPGWLVLFVRGRGRFPFPFPDLFFRNARWLDDERGDAPRLSFQQLASLFVNAAAIQILADAREDMVSYRGEQLFHSVLEPLMHAQDRPVFIAGETPEAAGERLAKAFPLEPALVPVLKAKLALRLARVESMDGTPSRLFPFTRDPEEASPRLVALDPRIRFGRPTLVGTGLPTDMIHERHQAGDSLASLAEDYGTPAELIEEAIRYEGASRDPFPLWWGMEG